MYVINPKYEILTPISDGGIDELKFIERIARVCYKSEDLIQEDGSTAKKLLGNLIKMGHEAMLEHSILTVEFTVDRGVSHELVRHRLASWAQESTRYCDYNKGKFKENIEEAGILFEDYVDDSLQGQLTFIKPPFWEDTRPEMIIWLEMMKEIEDKYMILMKSKVEPQQARSILPNSLKTTIVMTANYREWRNFFKLRADTPAHPQMRQVTIPLLEELKTRIPVIFDDIEIPQTAKEKGFAHPLE